MPHLGSFPSRPQQRRHVRAKRLSMPCALLYDDSARRADMKVLPMYTASSGMVRIDGKASAKASSDNMKVQRSSLSVQIPEFDMSWLAMEFVSDSVFPIRELEDEEKFARREGRLPSDTLVRTK
mmetsp:Transcript_67276/g.160457  ORF Transcript_67276/g.160457 Transcript_67276/m.160457 type:complete len:124 (+) Transcript_67276:3360-3731(+)